MAPEPPKMKSMFGGESGGGESQGNDAGAGIPANFGLNQRDLC